MSSGEHASADTDAEFERAYTFHERGELEQAEALYRRILAHAPRDVDAMHLLGVIQLQKQRPDAAVELIGRAVAIDPDVAPAHSSLGLAYHRSNRPAEALESYDRALALAPELVDTLVHRGNLLRELKRPREALESYDRALALKPDLGGAHLNRGNALLDLQQPAAALESYDRALALAPDSVDALMNRGNALRDLQRPRDALACYDRALALQPGYPEALLNRGIVLQDLGRHEDALASYERALALRPDYPAALFNRGNVLQQLKRPEEALGSYDRALALSPGHVESLTNRGAVLRQLSRIGEALASYDRALAVDPGCVDALTNRGNALRDLRRHEEALASFERALVLAPDHAGAHWNRSVCRLLLGDFEGGWEEYEWRWQYEAMRLTRAPFTQPQWDGADLDGVLLAWGEQGLGDQILHLSMLGDLARRVRKLIVAVDERLLPLLRRSFPRVTAVALEPAISGLSCDAHVPLGSIGRYLRRSWSDFPEAGGTGFLAADPDRTRALRARVAPGGERVCGLSWLSRSASSGQFKSMALEALRPVLELPGMRFVDLQYGDTREEREALDETLKGRLVRLMDIDNRNDIDGLAALVGACDAVVTVSNATAHLAGALGTPVMLLLPHAQGRIWYWHEDRDDSPWYPTARLFRQPRFGDWESAIHRARAELQAIG